MLKHVIDWWLRDDEISRFGEHLKGKSESADDSWHKRNPFFLDVPSMKLALPVNESWPIVFVNASVTQDGVFESCSESIEDKRRCGKIHVGHPERYEVCASIEHLQGSEFGTVGTFSTNNVVETIVLHDIMDIGNTGLLW